MSNSVICEITNDKYELIIGIWDNASECAKALGVPIYTIYNKLRVKNAVYKKTRLIKVWLEK